MAETTFNYTNSYTDTKFTNYVDFKSDQTGINYADAFSDNNTLSETLGIEYDASVFDNKNMTDFWQRDDSSSTNWFGVPKKEATRLQKSNKAKSEVQKLAGGGLRYPQDLFTNTSDWLSIDIKEFGPSTEVGSDGTQGPVLGNIATYMPANLSASYAQNWNSATLSPSGRMAMSAINAGIAARDGGGEIKEGVGAIIQKSLGGLGATVEAKLMSDLVGKFGDSNVGGAQGFVGLTQGMGINNTMELYWGGPSGQRSAAFQIKLSPRNRSEAKTVRDIVRTFKVAMHPSKSPGMGGANVGGRFVQYPFTFIIKYMTGSQENHHLNKWKPMVLQGFQSNYTPDGVYATNPDGSPVSTMISLQFKELKIVYADDIIDSPGVGF